MTEAFDEAFPEYLAMGMTYQQYWEMDCQLVIPYRKAYQIRQEMDNRAAWLQGVYIWKALQCAPLYVNGFVPKGSVIEPYWDKPLDFSAEKKNAKEPTNKEKIENGVAFMQMLAAKFNSNFLAKKNKTEAADKGMKQ